MRAVRCVAHGGGMRGAHQIGCAVCLLPLPPYPPVLKQLQHCTALTCRPMLPQPSPP